LSITAVIFDLDGVIVSTDEFHYLAWQRLADDEGIPFSRQDNNAFRGVSRPDCLEILLSKTARIHSPDEKAAMMDRKNTYYRQSLDSLGPKDILPGVHRILDELKARGIAIAIGSSSKNSPYILEKIGYAGTFDVTSDGNDIKKSKPDPEVFLIAARRLGKNPEECLVVEDAEAGIQAACNAGMRAFGVGAAARSPLAYACAADLDGISVEALLRD
jgi:beta-phosphoglucomutase